MPTPPLISLSNCLLKMRIEKHGMLKTVLSLHQLQTSTGGYAAYYQAWPAAAQPSMVSTTKLHSIYSSLPHTQRLLCCTPMTHVIATRWQPPKGSMEASTTQRSCACAYCKVRAGQPAIAAAEAQLLTARRLQHSRETTTAAVPPSHVLQHLPQCSPA
jgi:hypothetical protein